jgi:hypothetical protein
MTQPIEPPAPRPCASCPYRVDVPSGVWEASEYAKLPEYDNDTMGQPFGVFLCHQANGRACAGWVGCHDMTQSLGLRMAIGSGAVDEATADAILDYTTDVPLFTSGREAAEHGMARVDDPGDDAQRAMDKITRRRAAVGRPVDRNQP